MSANHGHYGNEILLSRASTDKETAIRKCLKAVGRQCQKYDKDKLDQNTDSIVAQVMSSNKYAQSDEGLHVIAESQVVTLVVEI